MSCDDGMVFDCHSPRAPGVSSIGNRQSSIAHRRVPFPESRIPAFPTPDTRHLFFSSAAVNTWAREDATRGLGRRHQTQWLRHPALSICRLEYWRYCEDSCRAGGPLLENAFRMNTKGLGYGG